MSLSLAVWVLLVVAVVAANLPWLSERLLFVWDPKNGQPRWTKRLGFGLLVAALVAIGQEIVREGVSHVSGPFWLAILLVAILGLILILWSPASGKSPSIRILEWLILYVIVGALALGLKQKSFGERHAQGWEFYAVTLCLFLVFALPGFIYRYDLKGHLERAKRRRR